MLGCPVCHLAGGMPYYATGGPAQCRLACLKLTPLLHAGAKMSYNVSYDAGLTLLTPTLLVPTEGVRVEVNGQVLSRGSDLAASQAEDTTAPTMGGTT